jgi:gliding motility-associated-like protein
MIKFCFSWILFFSPIFVFSQTSSIIGSAALNEYALGVCADNVGNVYFGATSDNDSWIFKRDVNNAILWSRKLNTVASGFSSDVSYIDIIGDTIFGCGWLKTGTSIEGSLLFKLNATTGATYWVKSESVSNTYFSCVKYANGKYFASGSQMNNAAGYNGKVMAVSSANGNIIWQTSAIGITFPGFGNDYIDDFYSSTEMVNGQMFITGRSYVNATSTNMRTFLLGINDLGTIFLQKYLEFNTSTPSDSRFYGISIEYDGPDSLIVLQYGDDDCFGCTDFKAGLIKTDLNGNVSWCKEYDLSGVSLEVGRGLDITPNGYMFYGYANQGQNNSKMFAVKTSKTGVFQMAKLISLGTGNMGHLSGPLNTGGSSNYKNGKHYIPGSYFTTNASSRDIAQIVLNDNLEDPQGCLTITPVSVTTNIFPPFSGVLNVTSPSNVMNLTIQPTPIQFNFISPCSANVTFTQNSTCNSSVITASVSTINNPSYAWSNGAIGNSTTTYSTDTLFVYVSNPITCCVVVDTIVPVFTPSNLIVSLPNDIITCSGSGITLNPTISPTTAGLTYLWSNQATTSSINATQSGTYWVSVSNGCQTVSDTLNLTINPTPVLTSVLADTICHQQNTNLTLTSTIPATFAWNALNNASVAGETTSNTNSNTIQDILLNNTTNNQLVSYVVTATAGACSSTSTIQITVLPPLVNPIITASGPTTFCAGGSVTLSSNYLNGNNWSTGETSQSITVSSSSTISLTVTINGCTSPSTSISINELNVNLPTASLTGGGTFCQGQNVTPVTVNFTGSGPWTLSYQINGVNQTPISTSNSTINLGQNAGNYVLTSLVDLNCTNTVNDASLIVINPLPIISFTADTLIGCAPLTVNFTGTSNGDPNACIWTLSNGQILVGCNPSFTFNQPGCYDVELASTLNNCSSSVNESQFICIANNPTIDNFNSTLESCSLSDGGITSSASLGTTPYSFVLYQGPTIVSSNPSGTFTGLQSGDYSLLVVDQIGCVDSVIVTVDSIPAPVVALQDTVICNLTLQINGVLSYTGTNWTSNSPLIHFSNATGQNPTIVADALGTYSITVTDSVCDFSETFQLTFLEEPFTQVLDTTLCVGETQLLTAMLQPQNTGYLWSTGASTSSISVTESGNYIVTASNSCGVSIDTATVEFTSCEIELPNVFTPNNDGENDYFQLLYFGGLTTFHCTILNRWGQVIREYNNPAFKWDGKTEDLDDVLEGVYFYIVNAEMNGGVEIKKHGHITLIR